MEEYVGAQNAFPADFHSRRRCAMSWVRSSSLPPSSTWRSEGSARIDTGGSDIHPASRSEVSSSRSDASLVAPWRHRCGGSRTRSGERGCLHVERRELEALARTARCRTRHRDGAHHGADSGAAGRRCTRHRLPAAPGAARSDDRLGARFDGPEDEALHREDHGADVHTARRRSRGSSVEAREGEGSPVRPALPLQS